MAEACGCPPREGDRVVGTAELKYVESPKVKPRALPDVSSLFNDGRLAVFVDGEPSSAKAILCVARRELVWRRTVHQLATYSGILI